MLINNFLALTAIGLLFDESVYVAIIEFIRCLIYITFTLIDNSINIYIYYIYLGSFCFWILYFIHATKSL